MSPCCDARTSPIFSLSRTQRLRKGVQGGISAWVLFSFDCFGNTLISAEVREALAPLKHKDVTTTRSDVARSASEVRTDHKDVTNVIAKLQAYEV